MKDLALELKTLQFKYDLLKKVQEKTPEIMMEDKEEELQMWKRYAYKLKPREDRMMKMVQYYREKNDELEEKLLKIYPRALKLSPQELEEIKKKGWRYK